MLLLVIQCLYLKNAELQNWLTQHEINNDSKILHILWRNYMISPYDKNRTKPLDRSCLWCLEISWRCGMALFLPFLLALGGLLNQFWEIFFYYFPGWFFSQCSLFFSFYHLEFGSPRLILSFSYLFSPISHLFFYF